MRVSVIENPEYYDFPLAELKGNPLVEALQPPPWSDDEAILRLAEAPLFDPSECELPSIIRMGLPNRLMNSFMFPSQQHVSIMKRLYIQILNGYKHRNPLTVEGQRLLYFDGVNNPLPNLERKEAVARPATISFLTGLSGMGKSTLIRAIMNTLGCPVIRHNNYLGTPFHETQLVYLMRNVPDQASAKSLCQSLGECADELSGAGYYAKAPRSFLTRTDYVRSLRKLVANYHVGAVVIDEFQNISLAKSGGAKELLALILNMRDELGVPIILVGTYKASELLKNSVSVARRMVDGGFYELERPMSSQNEDWRRLCEIAWEYQWLKNPRQLSDEIIETLYKCSQGVTGLFLNLYVLAQVEAIESESEYIDSKLIHSVYQKQFKPLHAVIDALKTGETHYMRQFDDMYLNYGRPKGCNSEIENMRHFFNVQETQQDLFYDKIPANRVKNSKTAEQMLHELQAGQSPASENIASIFK